MMLKFQKVKDNSKYFKFCSAVESESRMTISLPTNKTVIGKVRMSFHIMIVIFYDEITISKINFRFDVMESTSIDINEYNRAF